MVRVARVVHAERLSFLHIYEQPSWRPPRQSRWAPFQSPLDDYFGLWVNSPKLLAQFSYGHPGLLMKVDLGVSTVLIATDPVLYHFYTSILAG